MSPRHRALARSPVPTHTRSLCALGLALSVALALGACGRQRAPALQPAPAATATPAAATPAPAQPPSTPAAPLRTAPPVPPAPPAPRAAIEVSRGTRARAEIALTFDCAAGEGPTAEILAILREEQVAATFFMVGVWARDHPDLTRAIAERHELANHSWAHPDYRDLSDAAIAADLEQAEAFLVALTGHSTRPLWRAPSGARDDRVLAAAARAGWPVHVFWTIESGPTGTITGDSGDWRGLPAAEVRDNMLRAASLGGGVIAVSHCDSAATRDVLRAAIRAIRAAGLRIVTVSELLRE
ncbi:MAG: polysaccharide deacetylase family protein [Dehalococcoidia bacterium]|nr:polysaccharide deacetylase family protein [Dehalococcoidia bacterium]